MPCAQCNEGASDPASRRGERLAEEIPSLDLSFEDCDLGEHFGVSKEIGPILSQRTGKKSYLGLGEEAWSPCCSWLLLQFNSSQSHSSLTDPSRGFCALGHSQVCTTTPFILQGIFPSKQHSQKLLFDCVIQVTWCCQKLFLTGPAELFRQQPDSSRSFASI